MADPPRSPVHVGGVDVHHGDCREVLTHLDLAADAVITDPPYDLTVGGTGRRGFMGRSWDGTGVAFDPDTWRAVAARTRPNGLLVAFGGSRTWHRMACAIEDAGWQVGGLIAWTNSQGMPKSLNVAKSVESLLTQGTASWNAFRNLEGERRPGRVGLDRWASDGGVRDDDYCEQGGAFDLRPTTEQAARWMGWGTDLKPAQEPLVVAHLPAPGDTPTTATDAFTAFVTRLGGPLLYEPKAPRSEKPWQQGQVGKEQCAVCGGWEYGNPRCGCDQPTWERNAETTMHPTVKPLSLMRRLVAAAAPTDGHDTPTVLDPFAGTGTTGEAALIEGLRATLIELEPCAACEPACADHIAMIRQRLDKPIQPSLLGRAV